MTTSVGVFLNDSWISTKPLDERFVGTDMTVEMMMNIHELDANMDGGTVVSYSYEKTMGVTIDNGHFNVQVILMYGGLVGVQLAPVEDMLISWSLTKSGIMGPSPVGKFHPIVNPSCGPKIGVCACNITSVGDKGLSHNNILSISPINAPSGGGKPPPSSGSCHCPATKLPRIGIISCPIFTMAESIIQSTTGTTISLSDGYSITLLDSDVYKLQHSSNGFEMTVTALDDYINVEMSGSSSTCSGSVGLFGSCTTKSHSCGPTDYQCQIEKEGLAHSSISRYTTKILRLSRGFWLYRNRAVFSMPAFHTSCTVRGSPV
jgi:hypothetical protein